MHDQSELRELVLRHADELPPQQRVIADYLLEHTGTVPFLSVPALAQKTGVSEATVVRFAQRLGFSGFTELKMALVDLVQERLGAAPESAPADLPEDVLEAVAALESGNIQRTLAGIDRRVFDGVARKIVAADHVYAFGMGISSYLVDLACYNLMQVGVRAVALSARSTSPCEPVVLMGERDLVLVLSFPPYSRQTLDLLRQAGARGVATIAVTDRPTSPAARLARLALVVKSDNLMFTNAVAAVTVLFNALAAHIATIDRVTALAAISGINRVLAEEPTVLPSDA